MTVLDTLLRGGPDGSATRGSLEDPSVPLSAANLAEWLTGSRSDAGVAVTEGRVLGLPAYYRAVAVTAGTLAALPMHVYRRGTRQRIHTPTVLDAPNPRHVPIEFWVTFFANAITWGNGYARKLTDGAGIVRQVWPVHPGRVTVEEVDPHPATNPEGKLFLIRDRHGAEHRRTSTEIFHLPYMAHDGLVGVRPLEVFRQSLGLAVAGDDAAARFYANGSRVSGVLTTDQELTEAQAGRLKRRWKEKTSGVDHAGEVAVLDKNTTFTPISVPPEDAQLLESRRWSVAEVARMVGTPPHLVGDVERSTSWGTGIENQVLGWVKFTLQLWIGLTEQRVTHDLLPGGPQGPWFAETSLEGLLRGDSKTRAEFYRVMVMLGAMSPAQVRDLENWEPIEGLEYFQIPKNVTTIRPGEATPTKPEEGTDDD